MAQGSQRVLVLGAGGVGAPAAMRLAAAGVPVTLVDDDRVDASNLGRQVLYGDADTGEFKAIAAVRALQERFCTPASARVERFGRDERSLALVSSHALVVDGTDNFATRFAANDLCVRAGVPLVHAAAVGWTGQLLAVVPGETACLRCLFEDEPPPGAAPSCSQAGIVTPLVGLAGERAAAMALELLAGGRPEECDALRIVDARSGQTRLARAGRDPECRACGSGTRLPLAPAPECGAVLDITDERCPMTWVRTKLALESMAPGAVLEVLLGNGPMLRNVPHNAEQEGHEIVSFETLEPDRHRLRIRRSDGTC